MRKVFALLTVATLVFAVGPGKAFHEDDLPLIASAEGSSAGWASFRLDIDGVMGALDLSTLSYTGPVQAGFAFYNEAGEPLGAFVFTGFPGKQGVAVDLLPPDGPVHVEEIADNSVEGLFGVGLTYNDPAFTTAPFVGTVSVVMWWAGDSDVWTWAVRGLDGFSVTGRDLGDGAYLFDSDDFTSAAYAEMHQSNANVGAVGAHVQVQGDMPLEVENTLIGFYTFGLTAAGGLSITTPAGEVNCSGIGLPVSSGLVGGSSCFFLNMQGPGRAGPGDYVFHATSTGAGFTGAFEDIWFGGADARLPA